MYELDGISRASVEAHYKLYQSYVGRRNEILGKLAGVDLASANQIVLGDPRAEGRADLRPRRDQEPRALLRHLGGGGGDPAGAFGDLVERDFGSVTAWRADLKATGMAGRGWAWTACDWDERQLFNYIGDAQNTLPGLARRRSSRSTSTSMPTSSTTRPTARRTSTRSLHNLDWGVDERLGLEHYGDLLGS